MCCKCPRMGGPPAFPNPCRPETSHPKPLSPQPHASSAACPDRALPRHAVLRAAVAGHRWALGTPQRARGVAGNPSSSGHALTPQRLTADTDRWSCLSVTARTGSRLEDRRRGDPGDTAEKMCYFSYPSAVPTAREARTDLGDSVRRKSVRRCAERWGSCRIRDAE